MTVGRPSVAAFDSDVVRSLNRFVAFASLLSIAVGLLGLVGWTLGIAVLKSVIPRQVIIKPNAALALVLCGGALWLLRSRGAEPTSAIRKRAGQALASAAALIGLLSLAEHLLGWNFRIDQLLFLDQSPWEAFGSVRPGLMAPITALDFLLLGLALLCLDWTLPYKWWRWGPAELLAFMANTGAIVGLLDFVLGSHTSYTHIALQTALTLFVLSFAVACARAGWGLGALFASSSDGGLLTRRLWPSVIVLPLFVGIASWTAHSAGLLSEWGGITMMIVAMITLLAGLTVWSGESIERSDGERRRAQEGLLRANRAHRALSSCNQALIRATEESAWLDQVCRIIVGEAGYRFCWVGRAEHDQAKTVTAVAQAGVDEGYLRAVQVTWADTDRAQGPTGTCVRTRQTQIVKDTATDPEFAPWRTEALKRGYGSVIAIPILVGAEPFGALSIYATEAGAFRDEEVVLLSELADDLGYGVTTLRGRADQRRGEAEIRALNADLEQRVRARTADLEAARDREGQVGFRIQQMLLLTQPPTDVPGLQVAALTMPSQRIDGDFYDFFTHENQCLDVIVADVMGKGIPAALLAAATKTKVLEALCHLTALGRGGRLPEPKEIVTLAHADMVRQLIDLESFVTLSYARFDLSRNQIDLVDCGHTAMMVVRARTGVCETLHGNNLPLGIREGEIFDQIAITFEPGDLFLFYSDGITEMRDPSGELYGTDRLSEYVRLNRGLEPAALVHAIRDAAVAFAQSDRLNDDLTCVAVKVGDARQPTARAELEIGSDLRELRRAREFVRDFCREVSEGRLDEDDVSELELAVNEAASNIMKHAYRGRGDQRIQLDAHAVPGRVSIRLHHLGDSFDPAAVPPPALDGSRESGFGIYLINKSVDDVRYSRDERGRNCIALVKVLNSRD